MVSYYLGIISALLVLGVVFELLRRGRLKERQAFWWIIAGLLGLIVGIFPGVLTWLSSLFGIEIPLNLVLFSSVVILFLVSLQHSSEVTRLEEKVRVLAEGLALLKDSRD